MLDVAASTRRPTGSNDRRSPLPLPMWPTVLESAYERSYQIYDLEGGINGCSKEDIDTFKSQDKNVNGVYYLFRNRLVSLHDCSLNGRGSSDN